MSVTLRGTMIIEIKGDAEDQDEAEWAAQFAATPTSAFEALIEEGLADFRHGQTDEFDPDTEDD